jgi:hypothetical protein
MGLSVLGMLTDTLNTQISFIYFILSFNLGKIKKSLKRLFTRIYEKSHFLEINNSQKCISEGF